jgi:hypothetical protein
LKVKMMNKLLAAALVAAVTLTQAPAFSQEKAEKKTETVTTTDAKKAGTPKTEAASAAKKAEGAKPEAAASEAKKDEPAKKPRKGGC